ncbi:vitamin K epoxide reductase family protein [Candidatus Gottesmanbacteria bacterium]|nr:vitamin K epoxide reductase family protein [Candidatus Gottesmanbacteria bacterium]
MRKSSSDRDNRIIFVLSVIGVLIAIYVLQSFLRQTSIVCINTGCEVVRKSPSSYIFGIPVPTFGLVGYSIIALLAFLRTMSSNKKLLLGILAVSTFGILFVSWFTLTEIFIIGAICTWCAVSALNMMVIFSFTLKSYINTIGKLL